MTAQRRALPSLLLSLVACAWAPTARAQDRPSEGTAAASLGADEPAAWRPQTFAGDGALIGTGAVVALGRRGEVDGALLFEGEPGNAHRLDDARLDARVELWSTRNVQLLVGGGWQQIGFDHAATVSLTARASVGRLAFAAEVRAVHYFAGGRDPLDVSLTVGALVRASKRVHVGVEYVGEELESAVGGDDDGPAGGRHWLGPTATIVLARSLTLRAGAGAMLTPTQAAPLGRVALAWRY